MHGQFVHNSGTVTVVQLGGEPQFGSVVSYWNLVPSNVTSNRFAPANQLPWTEDAESNDAPVKSASRRSCADRHEPGPNCTPWKLAPRAVLPLPVAAPNTLLAHWVLLKSAEVAVTPSNTAISNIVPENCASVRSTPFSVTWLRLASWKIAPVNRTGVAPLGWKVRHARFAMVKSAWLISMPARLAPARAGVPTEADEIAERTVLGGLQGCDVARARLLRHGDRCRFGARLGKDGLEEERDWRRGGVPRVRMHQAECVLPAERDRRVGAPRGAGNLVPRPVEGDELRRLVESIERKPDLRGLARSGKRIRRRRLRFPCHRRGRPPLRATSRPCDRG